MKKPVVLAVAVLSYVAGAWLSPFVSASAQQDAVLLASIPSQLKQGQRTLFEPTASVTCDVIRQHGTWIECERSLYVNLVSGVSYRITPDTK
jgi:hypothetical protein